MPGGGVGILFEYETQKIVQINSTKVGIINRLIQLLIISYIIGWVMIYKKGYQEKDELISSVTSKVKGIGFVNMSDNPTYGERIWDTADYVHPPQEYNSFFITTNAIITKKQKPGLCAEQDNIKEAHCDTEKRKCERGFTSVIGTGMFTGKCLYDPNKKNGTEGLCEVHSWCPGEIDSLPYGKTRPLFPMVRDYTILLKNDIEFPKFQVKRRNIISWSQKKFLYKCRYNENHPEHKFCPIISVGTILDEIRSDDKLLIKGGVIGIFIKWNCNLDWNVKYCNPKYTFHQLNDKRAKIAKGYNFRYAHYYYINGTKHRDLIKAYGIKFLIFVTGKAGKFNLIPLTMNLGSGLALLGLASVLCDLIVLHLLGQKGVYQKAKYEAVDESSENHLNGTEPTLTNAASPPHGNNRSNTKSSLGSNGF